MNYQNRELSLHT